MLCVCLFVLFTIGNSKAITLADISSPLPVGLKSGEGRFAMLIWPSQLGLGWNSCQVQMSLSAKLTLIHSCCPYCLLKRFVLTVILVLENFSLTTRKELCLYISRWNNGLGNFLEERTPTCRRMKTESRKNVHI